MEYLGSILLIQVSEVLVEVSSDPPGKVHVLPHESRSLGVDGTQVGVLEHTGEVGFGGFLKSVESLGLEAEFSIDVTADVADKSVEGSSW